MDGIRSFFDSVLDTCCCCCGTREKAPKASRPQSGDDVIVVLTPDSSKRRLSSPSQKAHDLAQPLLQSPSTSTPPLKIRTTSLSQLQNYGTLETPQSGGFLFRGESLVLSPNPLEIENLKDQIRRLETIQASQDELLKKAATEKEDLRQEIERLKAIPPLDVERLNIKIRALEAQLILMRPRSPSRDDLRLPTSPLRDPDDLRKIREQGETIQTLQEKLNVSERLQEPLISRRKTPQEKQEWSALKREKEELQDKYDKEVESHGQSKHDMEKIEKELSKWKLELNEKIKINEAQEKREKELTSKQKNLEEQVLLLEETFKRNRETISQLHHLLSQAKEECTQLKKELAEKDIIIAQAKEAFKEQLDQMQLETPAPLETPTPIEEDR